MNIFGLHPKPRKCARYHVNRHVVKMILEYAQQLSTCWHVIDPEHKLFCPTMKPTHKNHPCSKWVRESTGNYKWLCELALELCKEYTYRYNRVHKTEAVISVLALNIPPLPSDTMTRLPLAMPDEFKTDSVVKSYRLYYKHGKKHIHAWKNRDTPKFIGDSESE